MGTEAQDHPETHGTDHAVMSKRLSRVDIAEVGLDDRELRGGHGISQRNGVVGEGPWIENHGVGPGASVMERIDQSALVVRLHVADLGVALAGNGGEVGDDVVECVGAVDLGLACAQKIQVRTVQHEDLVRHGVQSTSCISQRQ